MFSFFSHKIRIRALFFLITGLWLIYSTTSAQNFKELEEKWLIKYDSGVYFYNQGKIDSAIDKLNEALEIGREDYSRNGFRTLLDPVLEELIFIYYQEGKLKEGELLFKKNVDITESVKGRFHPEYVKALDNLLAFYQDTGQTELISAYVKLLILPVPDTATIHDGYSEALMDPVSILMGIKDYESAGQLLNKALEITTDKFGSFDQRTYQMQLNLAQYYTMTDNIDSAEAIFRLVLLEREKYMGTAHPDYIHAIRYLFRFYIQSGQNDKAEDLITFSPGDWKEGIIFDSSYPDATVLLGNDLSKHGFDIRSDEIYLMALSFQYNLNQSSEAFFNTLLKVTDHKLETGKNVKVFIGEVKNEFPLHFLKQEPYSQFTQELIRQHEYHSHEEEAEFMYLEILQSIRNEDIRTTVSFLDTFSKLAGLYFNQGKVNKADSLFIQYKSILIHAPFNSTQYETKLKKLGNLYAEHQQYKLAEMIFDKVIRLMEESDNLTRAYQAWTLADIGRTFYLHRQYAVSRKYYYKMLDYSKSLPDSIHEEYYPIAIKQVSNSFFMEGKIDSARFIYEIASSAYSEDPENPIYNNLLNQKAWMEYRLGQYDSAVRTYNKALQLSLNHPYYGTSLGGLGWVYLWMGRYQESEYYLRKALEFYHENGFENYAHILNNLAGLYYNMGRYEEAKNYFEQVVRHNSDRKNTYSYASALFNLSMVFEKMDQLDTTIQIMTEVYDLFNQIYGEDHLMTARTLLRLGHLKMKLSEYNEAELILLKSDSILRKNLGASHPWNIETMKKLADLYKATGQYQRSELLLKHIIDLERLILGQSHPSYGKSLKKLAVLYTASTKLDSAQLYFELTLENHLHQIRSFFPGLSEKEKTQFYQNIQPVFEQFNNFALARFPEKPQIASVMYNCQLATKALLFHSLKRIRERILSSGDQELINEYNTWLILKETLAKLYRVSEVPVSEGGQSVDSLGSQSTSRQQVILADSLEKEANDLERMLSAKIESFADLSTQTERSWTEVRDQLMPGEAALEIIRIQIYDFDSVDLFVDSVCYAGLLVTPETESHPELILWANGVEMEQRYLKYYHNAIQYQLSDSLSYSIFWQPVQDHLEKIRKIYISSDGVYNQINLNTLFNPSTGKYLLEEIDLVPVTNTKDLITDLPDNKVNNLAVFVGNPDFKMEHTSSKPDHGDQSEISDTYYYLQLERSASFDRLPGTETEVLEIGQYLKKKKWNTRILLGNEALEERVKSIQNPEILHIATHGYFDPDPKDNASDNPLLRSGLLLAGAAHALSPEALSNTAVIDPSEDGVLTAYEAMNLILDGTSLVVLSACETGKGEIMNGEGVYGLQRAFTISGAKSIIMSLWKVNDYTTRELMTSFYNYWFITKNKREAFRLAQKDLKEKYPEAYYWGAFVMIGE